MCGVWRTRSAYELVFRIQSKPATARSSVTLPPPPPISPVVASNKYEHDFGLQPIEHEDDIDAFADEPGVVKLSMQKTFISTVYDARTQTVTDLRNSRYNKKRHISVFSSKIAIGNVVAILENSRSPVVLDLTNSLIMGITVKALMPTISVTACVSAASMSNKAVESLFETSRCGVIRSTLTDMQSKELVNYTHIIADFIKTPFDDIERLLTQFSASVTTSAIYTGIMPSVRNELARTFLNLEFTYLSVMFTKNPDFLTGDTRARLVRIRHRMSNNQPSIRRTSKKRPLRQAETAPAVLQHCPEPPPLREPSPLTTDFSYGSIGQTFFQEQLEYLVNEHPVQESTVCVLPTAQLDDIAPFVESIPEDIPLNPVEIHVLDETPATPIDDIQHDQDAEDAFHPDTPTDEVENEDEGDFYPETPINNIEPENVSVEKIDNTPALCESPHVEALDVIAQQYSPVIACQDDYDDDDAIIILSDDEEEVAQGIELNVQDIQRRLKSRRSAFKTFRETLPVCSSADFGGSCPTAGNHYVSAMADIICEYVRTHEGPYNFLDVRSRSIVAAHLSTVFPSTVSFGHLAYSREYLFSIRQTHQVIAASLKTVNSPLSEINPNTFDGYQMIYTMAPWMDRDNDDLKRIILSFLANDSTRVLWLQLKAEQYKNLRESLSHVNFTLRRAKMPGIEGSLYEILK